MTLRSIRVEEAFFLRMAALQWNKDQAQFNLKKLKKRKLVIVHCETSSRCQLGFYSVQIWMLNTQFPIAKSVKFQFVKIVHLNSRIKKPFLWQFYKKKEKSFARIEYFLQKQNHFSALHWAFSQITKYKFDIV